MNNSQKPGPLLVPRSSKFKAHAVIAASLVVFVAVIGMTFGSRFGTRPGSVFASAAPAVYGMAAVGQLDKLPYLHADTQAGGQSSYQRDTATAPAYGNNDFGNYLAINGADHTLLDQKGPGTVYRLWFTSFAASDTIRVYFDGESSPRINMPLQNMFNGANGAFRYPLVADASRSSGGFTSYVPLTYKSSIKIVSTTSSYYNIGYHSYSPDTVVSTWTGNEDSTAARASWTSAGVDPKPDTGNVTQAGTVSLAPNAPTTLLDTAGPRSISSIKVKIPGVTPSTSLTDNGRAHKGSSRFTVALNSSNTGATLKRRLDYGVANQRAGVYVDGAYVGDWFNGGLDTAYNWRDDSFYIPSNFTAGKSKITVQIRFVSSSNDWNEFYYWVYSSVGGHDTQTDTVDIGNTTSESAHGYSITSQTWNGTQKFAYLAQTTDDGRAHKGTSQFTLATDAANTGVTLVRRTDYGIADQKATVSVDGQTAGTWSDAGSDPTNRWRNSSFQIPAALTAGKSSVHITITFVSSSSDWNEFYYWAYSTVAGNQVQTDALDVGNSVAESAHAYAISGQTFSGTRTFQYNTVDLLNNTRIRISWDGEATPSVDAPLGSFFGMGQFGAYNAQALPMGIDSSNTFYMYFPMPFQAHATISLVNTGAQPETGLTYEIKHKPFTDSFATVAYFKTAFNSETPSTPGKDIKILDTTGTGTFVGAVASYTGDTSRGYLEGDERMYVDDSSSPAIHGTGTEDFFNGGYYFSQGLYAQPMSGNTAHVITPTTDSTSAYRLMLQDAVPFNKSLRVSIEHGGHDEVSNNAWMLAYYYQRPTSRATLTDTLNVANQASESAHAYSIAGQTWTGTRTFSYEGTADKTTITDDGRAHKGSSQFNMAITPSNQGVILRRRFDQTVPDQRANVYVNGTYAGTWYRAGSNPFHQWRDDDFMIPSSLTNGKSSIQVKVQFVSSGNDWNEFTYSAYSLTP